MTERGAIILGTAGHIDHGKTALVRNLTGQDTDRLKEEQERGISIDLGFAAYEVDGRQLGVIDVPGHERFIRNMLAGAHGIDLVLLVVAADDGVMPQTEEHLDILHLLGVRRGIFVITKTDLVDPERIAAVRGEIEILACGTNFEGAPILEVSNLSGAGLPALRAEIHRQLENLPARSQRGHFRLPIDRAFLLHGHGLVVTGTAIAGSIREGDSLRIQPSGIEVRTRGLQVHGAVVKEAHVGQRIAVNLSGIDKDQVQRGAILADPRITITTDRLDCWIEIRPAAEHPLKSFDGIRLYMGTSEILGRVIVLGENREIAPKSSGYGQILLDQPALAASGDRFILRTGTATRTIGGGIVVQPFAARHKSSESGVTSRLERLHHGKGAERLTALLALLPDFGAPPTGVAQALGVTLEEVHSMLAGTKSVLGLPNGNHPEIITTREKWADLQERVVSALAHYAKGHALQPAMELEALRSRLPAMPPKLFRPVIEILAATGIVVREEALVRLPSQAARIDASTEQLRSRCLEALQSGGFAPPDTRALSSTLGVTPRRLMEVLQLLEREGAIIRISPDLWYTKGATDEARRLLTTYLASHPEITAAEFRNLLGASRKYSIPLLDYFDRAALTIRVGDVRRLRRQ